MEIKSLGLKWLAVEEEQKELRAVGERVILKQERPQKNYKLVDDIPVMTGWLEMFTIENDFFDSLGRNRKGSTFGIEGLTELGIKLEACTILKQEVR